MPLPYALPYAVPCRVVLCLCLMPMLFVRMLQCRPPSRPIPSTDPVTRHRYRDVSPPPSYPVPLPSPSPRGAGELAYWCRCGDVAHACMERLSAIPSPPRVGACSFTSPVLGERLIRRGVGIDRRGTRRSGIGQDYACRRNKEGGRTPGCSSSCCYLCTGKREEEEEEEENKKTYDAMCAKSGTPNPL